jgi:hypothetical protein
VTREKASTPNPKRLGTVGGAITAGIIGSQRSNNLYVKTPRIAPLKGAPAANERELQQYLDDSGARERQRPAREYVADGVCEHDRRQGSAWLRTGLRDAQRQATSPAQ